MTAAVEVRGVSKRFRLYHERYTSLKERAIHFGKVPYDDFWALKDLSFDVEPGVTLGLLGHNGSGKSTLLKCITGILQPSSGEIRTRGRVAALLELGAGFHPDLTGRENVFLNASLLGMGKKEVAAKLDDIVAFAELEPFIDNQVKYYSSGMYVRLGFAVAVNMDPEILIVDEVLSVGDELFQRKCIERVKQFQRDGRTIIVVTHAADMVRQICDQAGVLDQGVLVCFGSPGEAVRTFREHLLQRQAYREAELLGEPPSEPDSSADQPPLNGDEVVGSHRPPRVSVHEPDSQPHVKITHVYFDHPGAEERPYLVPGEPLTVHIGFHATERVSDIVPSIVVYDMDGRMLFSPANQATDDMVVGPGDGEMIIEFDSVPLLDGTYPVTIGLVSRDEATVYDWHEQKYHVAVISPTRSRGVLYIPTRIRLQTGVEPVDNVDQVLGA